MLYSLNNINASSPYFVSEYDERSVCFQTDNGVGYQVSFIVDENLGVLNTFPLIIANNTSNVFTGVDPKIGQTVASILKSFFESNQEHVLLYFCDPSDKHEAARNRKFCGWYNRYADKNSLAMINEAITVDDAVFYVSVVFNRRMKNAEELETTFRSYIKELKSK